MNANANNLIRVFASLGKTEKGRIKKEYERETGLSGFSFSRRIKAKSFPEFERQRLDQILEKMYPQGFPDAH
jgi:hypothetical protein